MDYSLKDIIKKNIKFPKEQEIIFLEELISDLSFVKQMIFLESYKESRNKKFVMFIYFAVFFLLFSCCLLCAFGIKILYFLVPFSLLYFGYYVSLAKKCGLNYENYVKEAKIIHNDLKKRKKFFEWNFETVDRKNKTLNSENETVHILCNEKGINLTGKTKETIDYKNVRFIVHSREYREVYLNLKDGKNYVFMGDEYDVRDFISSVNAFKKYIK